MITLATPGTLLSYIKMVKLCSTKLFRPRCIKGDLGHYGEGRTANTCWFKALLATKFGALRPGRLLAHLYLHDSSGLI